MTTDERNKKIAEWLKRWTVADFDYADDQSKAFTPHHSVYDFTLKFDGEKVYSGTFNFNPDHWPKAADILEAVVDDASSYAQYRGYPDEEDGMFEFMDDLGYLENAKSAKKGKDAWKGCKKEYKAIMKVVDNFCDLQLREDDDEIIEADDRLGLVYDYMNGDEFDRSTVKFEEE